MRRFNVIVLQGIIVTDPDGGHAFNVSVLRVNTKAFQVFEPRAVGGFATVTAGPEAANGLYTYSYLDANQRRELSKEVRLETEEDKPLQCAAFIEY